MASFSNTMAGPDTIQPTDVFTIGGGITFNGDGTISGTVGGGVTNVPGGCPGCTQSGTVVQNTQGIGLLLIVAVAIVILVFR